jgi:hypothetical protein
MYNKYRHKNKNETSANVYEWVYYQKMHNIFARTSKVNGAHGAYDDRNQVALKRTSILNFVGIDKDVAQEITKSLQNQ